MSFKLLLFVLSTLVVVCRCDTDANDLVTATLNEYEIQYLEIIELLCKNEERKMQYGATKQPKLTEKIHEYNEFNKQILKNSSVPLTSCLIDANQYIQDFNNSAVVSCFVTHGFVYDLAKLQERLFEISLVGKACKGEMKCVEEKIENLKNDWDKYFVEIKEHIRNFNDDILKCIDYNVPLQIDAIEQAEMALNKCLNNNFHQEPDTNDLITTAVYEAELQFLDMVEELAKNQEEALQYGSINQPKVTAEVTKYIEFNKQFMKNSSVKITNCLLNANKYIQNLEYTRVASCIDEDYFRGEIVNLQRRLVDISLIGNECNDEVNCVKETIEKLSKDWDRSYSQYQVNIESFRDGAVQCVDSDVPYLKFFVDVARFMVERCVEN